MADFKIDRLTCSGEDLLRSKSSFSDTTSDRTCSLEKCIHVCIH